MTPAQAAALEEYRKYVEQYASRTPGQYAAQGQLDFDEMSDTAMGDIVTDPRYKENELAALNELGEQSRTGFTASDLADITRTENLANRANRGRIESIRQNMQTRGLGGSGLDVMAQLQSAQDANEMAALKALEREGMMQDRKSQATMNLGGLSSQLQGRDFEQEASKARAHDAIKQFNTQNRNQARQYNYGNRQDVANRNVQTGNDQADKQFTARSGLATTNYNAATDDYNQAQMRKAERDRKRAGAFSGLAGAAGGIAGGVLGSAAGPMGTAAGASIGYQAGSALGNAASNYAHGGRIPGQSPFPGDNEMNDIFEAYVSPGEIVVPRTIAQDPEASKRFVAAQNMGMDPMASKYIANDSYEALPPPEVRSAPPSPARGRKPTAPPQPGRPKPIPEPVLQELSKQNPGLVEQYRARMGAADKEVKSAEETQSYLNLAGTIGKGLTDFGNSQKDNVILANRWQDMGKRPDVVEPERQGFDSSGIDRIGAMGVQRAKEGRNREEGEFFKEQQLGQMDRSQQKEQAMNDPQSPESQSARAFLQSLLPNAGQIKGFDQFSAARLEKVSPMLMEKWKAEQAQSNADRDFGLREKELGVKANQRTKLSGEEQKRLDSAGMALAGVQGMRKALASGDNTFSVIGDNDFTLWRADFEEGLGRMQSGGVIGEDEIDRFRKMAPTATDSAAMQEKKLQKLESELGARISGLGQSPDKALSDRGVQQYKNAPHGPRVKQNGVTFEWNGSEYIQVGG